MCGFVFASLGGCMTGVDWLIGRCPVSEWDEGVFDGDESEGLE